MRSPAVRPFVAVLLTTTAACRTLGGGDEASAVKITNGKPATGYSAVVRLDTGNGSCTGTFVDDATVLTAAHCIEAWHGGNHDYPQVGGWTPDAIYYNATFFQYATAQGAILPGGDRYDLAIVKFGAGAGAAAGVQQYPKVADTFPGLGTAVTLVGYGLTDANDEGSNPDAKLYVGQNTIATAGNGAIGIVGPCATSNTTTVSATAPGDSGGPLLTSDYTILGVVSNGSCVGGTMSSHYTAVTHDTAKQLLAQAGVATGSGSGSSNNNDDNGGATGGGSRVCGKVTQNTTVCLNAGHDVLTVHANQSDQESSGNVDGANPSTTLPGATSYTAVVNLSWISGFSAQTHLAFVINESAGQGRLMYQAAGGWALWPGSGTFPLFNPD